MLDRRQFVLAAASVPFLSWQARAASSGELPVAPILDRFIHQFMIESPQLMTRSVTPARIIECLRLQQSHLDPQGGRSS